MFNAPVFDAAANSRGMWVFVDDMTVEMFVGIHDHEHHERQPVTFSLELRYGYLPVEGGAHDFVDYECLCNDLSVFLEGKPHTRLLEALALEIAGFIFVKWSAIDELVVVLHKPKARKHSRRLGVELRWSRLDYEAQAR